ncbi:MAG TPA: ComF family protein [Fusibacter sp.]|nr:ComF family protein [Fusibacter sp.]
MKSVKFKLKTIFMRHLITGLLDFFMPEHLTCNFCEAEMPPKSEKPICETCHAHMVMIDGHLCEKCGRPIDVTYAQHADYFFRCKECQENFVFFHKHRAFTHYDEGVKTGLMGLKYKKQVYQAVYFGECLAKMVNEDVSLNDFDLVVPVPVHFLRRLNRGYNQAEVLASHMCKHLGIEPPSDLLIRKRVTKKLKNLDKESRKLMLENAIIVDKNAAPSLKNKRILLVDDIYTTGTTLNACARALYEAGCERICCITVARGK